MRINGQIIPENVERKNHKITARTPITPAFDADIVRPALKNEGTKLMLPPQPMPAHTPTKIYKISLKPPINKP